MPVPQMFRSMWIVAISALAVSCGSEPAAVDDRSAPADVATVADADPAGTVEAEKPVAGTGHYRFVGRWVAEAALCADGAWRFAPDSLITPAGAQCSFRQVTAVPGGYDIVARCTAEGPTVDDRLELRFAESAHALLFQSGSIADAGLIYCGPLSG